MSELQYITDTNGQRTAVILSIEEYEELVADMRLRDIDASGEEEEDRLLAKAMELSEDSPEVSREEVFAALRGEP
jgi:hypothetical protein